MRLWECHEKIGSRSEISDTLRITRSLFLMAYAGRKRGSDKEWYHGPKDNVGKIINKRKKGVGLRCRTLSLSHIHFAVQHCYLFSIRLFSRCTWRILCNAVKPSLLATFLPYFACSASEFCLFSISVKNCSFLHLSFDCIKLLFTDFLCSLYPLVFFILLIIIHIQTCFSRCVQHCCLFCARYFLIPAHLLLCKPQLRHPVEYCSPVWGGASSTFLALLDRSQQTTIRPIDGHSLTSALQSITNCLDGSLTLFWSFFKSFFEACLGVFSSCDVFLCILHTFGQSLLSAFCWWILYFLSCERIFPGGLGNRRTPPIFSYSNRLVPSLSPICIVFWSPGLSLTLYFPICLSNKRTGNKVFQSYTSTSFCGHWNSTCGQHCMTAVPIVLVSAWTDRVLLWMIQHPPFSFSRNPVGSVRIPSLWILFHHHCNLPPPRNNIHSPWPVVFFKSCSTYNCNGVACSLATRAYHTGGGEPTIT